MRPTCASNSPTSSRIKTSAAIFCSARFQVCPELDHLANAMVGQASSLSLDSGYFSGADPRSARVPWTRSSGSAARPLAVFASPPLENRTELFDKRKAKGGEFLRKGKTIAKRNKLAYRWDPERGKKEIGPGLLADMCRQLARIWGMAPRPAGGGCRGARRPQRRHAGPLGPGKGWLPLSY